MAWAPRRVLWAAMAVLSACLLSTDDHAAGARANEVCLTAATVPPPMTTGFTAAPPPQPLPAGYLATRGNQIVDTRGRPVRLACVGYFTVRDVHADLPGMAAAGFNCLRYPWYDATLVRQLLEMDDIVATAGRLGLKVVFDHHGNEQPSAANNYLPYPCNGLPFDLGPGTDGTDGCGDTGTIDRARLVRNWVAVAQRYAGNATVIGFDLQNEPHFAPRHWAHGGGATWGDGAPTDLRAIYEELGTEVQRVNPGVLIICEGIILYRGRLASGAPMALNGAMDLSFVPDAPVRLPLLGKVVYSVHDYPQSISDVKPSGGPLHVQAMNDSWGFIVTRGIAPVWIGEMGASLDGIGPDSQGWRLKDEQAWASTMLAYLNGQCGTKGGPTFPPGTQPIGTSWWAWGQLEGQSPNGTLNATGRLRSGQADVYRQLRPRPPLANNAAMAQPSHLEAAPIRP